MKKVFNYFLLVFAVILCSCANSQMTPNPILNACIISKQELFDFRLIDTASTSIISKSEDSCVIALIDTLVNRSIRSRDVRYLKAINAIAIKSDGYVSEYLTEAGRKLFYQNFKAFFLYNFDNRKSTKEGLSKVFVEAISMELSDSENPSKREKEIDYFINKQIKTNRFNSEQVQFLRELQAKFDPALFN